MNKPIRLTALLVLCLLAAGPGAILADHIPGHDACDPTFPAPIPGQNDFSGGGVILFVTLIGPEEDTVITGTTFDVTYVSDGTTPASELELVVSVQLDSGEAEVSVLGSDLGFGSGPGTFVGTLQTSALNGVVAPGIPAAVVRLEITRSDGGPIEGTAYFEDSFIVFDVIPPPPCEQPETGVPTVSEWGLILIALLLLTVATLVFGHATSVATSSQGNLSLAIGPGRLFVPRVFAMTLVVVASLVGTGLSVAFWLHGEVTSVDLTGALLCTPLLSYLVHLWLLPTGDRD
jgi:hypothetical protein